MFLIKASSSAAAVSSFQIITNGFKIEIEFLSRQSARWKNGFGLIKIGLTVTPDEIIAFNETCICVGLANVYVCQYSAHERSQSLFSSNRTNLFPSEINWIHCAEVMFVPQACLYILHLDTCTTSLVCFFS